MTLHEAISALLEEYHLEEFVELVREDVRGDPDFEGLSLGHPRVQRFKDVCRTLRAEPNIDVARALSRLRVIVAALECPRCYRPQRAEDGGIFLPGAYCDHCHSGVIATDDWKDAMRALGR